MTKKLNRSKTISPNKNVLQLYVTFPDPKIAKKISHTLLKEKLIACANIFPAVTSIYEWQNKIETSREVVVIFKTTKKKSKLAMERLQVLHPYECPCIVELRPIRGLKPYFEWVESID